MKILIVTRSAWDDTNSTGNTMSNFFSGYDSNKLANIYFREALPNNEVCNTYFSISDKDVLKSALGLQKNSGSYFQKKEDEIGKNESHKIEENIYSHFRKLPSYLMLWAQNKVWDFGGWKSNKLDSFLEEFQPDIIFSPTFHTLYTHKVLWYLQDKTKAKVVLFHADDYLTINKSHNKLIKRQEEERAATVRESILKADLNYCISEKQKIEYKYKTGKEMKVLYKGANFLKSKPEYNYRSQQPIEIVYVGSILYGRWKTLAMLARKIKKYNKTKEVYKLKIYSQYQLTKEMRSQMIIEGASEFLGKISPKDIEDVYKKTDIVLHTESFEETEKMMTRLSFSTKIVDCLNSGRTILAIGWEEAASIDYLINNDAALVATNEEEIFNILQEIQRNPSILEEYANKAWNCGKKNHQLTTIQKSLYDDFRNILRE